MSKKRNLADTKIGKWILGKLEENLNGKYKRVQGDRCAVPDFKQGRSLAEEASKDIYERIWSRKVLDELTKEFGLVFPNWGDTFEAVKFKNDQKIIKFGQYGGIDPATGTYIAVGLRLCKSLKDWNNGAARGATGKTLRTKDSKTGHYRPQIAICFEDEDFFDFYQSKATDGGGSDAKRVYDPWNLAGWNKVKIKPLLFEIPVIGYAADYNPTPDEERPLRLSATEDSRHAISNETTKERATRDEHLQEIEEEAEELVAMGRDAIKNWRKPLTF